MIICDGVAALNYVPSLMQSVIGARGGSFLLQHS